MILQVGKRYVTRDGNKTGPLRARWSIDYPFEATLEDEFESRSWTRDGKFYPYAKDSPFDLVAEYAGYVGPAKDQPNYEYDPSNPIKRPTDQSLTLEEHVVKIKQDIDAQTEPAPELINQIRKEEREKALDEAKAYFSGLVEDFLKKGEEMAITPDAEDCDDPIIKHGIWFSNIDVDKLTVTTAMVSVSELKPWKEPEETPNRKAFKEWASQNFVGGNQFHIFQAGWEAAKNDRS